MSNSIQIRLCGAAALAALAAPAFARAQKPSPNLHEVWSVQPDSATPFSLPRSITAIGDCTVWFADPRTGLWQMPCTGGPPARIESDSGAPHHLSEPALVTRYRGDTVMVWDRGLRQLALFAPNGAFTRMAPLRVGDSTTGRPVAMTPPLPDGTFRAWTNTFPEPGGQHDRRSYVLVVRADGLVRDSVARFDGAQSIVYDSAGLFGRIEAPLQRKPFVTFFHDGSFLAATNDRAQLGLFDALGRRLRTIMLPLPEPGRVTAADRAAFTDSARRAIEREMEARAYDDSVRVGIRQMFEPVLRDATFPDTRQRFDQLVLDEKEATVWIQLPGTGASYTRTWFICSLTDMSFCRTQVIPHQGAVVAVAIHGGSVYAVEQLRDGGVRVARYGSN